MVPSTGRRDGVVVVVVVVVSDGDVVRRKYYEQWHELYKGENKFHKMRARTITIHKLPLFAARRAEPPRAAELEELGA